MPRPVEAPSPDLPPRAPRATAAPDRGEPRTRLQAARMARGWTQERVLHEFCKIAAQLDIPVGRSSSLKTHLSRWENGHKTPDAQARRIFRTMYGLTDEELGLTDHAPTRNPFQDAAEQLAGQLRAADTLDPDMIEALARQTDQLRLLDRRLGGAVLLDQMSAHVHTIDQLLNHAIKPAQRRTLARALADTGALAGWQALDAGAVQRAWRHFTLARSAALEADRPELLAHAMGEHAYALLELGRPDDAVDLIDQAGTVDVPDLLRSWLAAAKGEMLASTGETTEALRAFDRAARTLPSDGLDETLPFLALDEVHLARWRGNALARLQHPAAVDQLTGALAALDPSFVRAACTLHTDLAHAYATTGEREQARAEARTARQLAVQIGSQRLLRRLAELRLPVPERQQPEQAYQ